MSHEADAMDLRLSRSYETGKSVDAVARECAVTRGRVLAACRRSGLRLRDKSAAQILRKAAEKRRDHA